MSEQERSRESEQGGWLSFPAKVTGRQVAGHVPLLPAPPDNVRRNDDLPVFKRSKPKRNRWPDLANFDERVRELNERTAALNGELGTLSERLWEALDADREALTAWQMENGNSPRPEPTASAVEREIEERTADRAAVQRAILRVLEEKAAYVSEHRKQIVREADKATEEARARCLALIDALEEARAELAECRAASLWAQFFPGELANTLPQVQHLATGLRRPIERALGVPTWSP